MPPPFSTALLPARAVMGVVNVTPDSFSGDGTGPADAIARGRAQAAAGAAVVDVGGESTRPGAESVAVDEELRRVLPVVRALAAEVPVSIDTSKAEVAAAALEAGAVLVNDVSAGRRDPGMLGVVAAAGAGFVAMHMRGTPRTMREEASYDDVVREVGDELADALAAAREAGIRPDALLGDPGIGFAKTAAQSLLLLGALTTLRERLGVPLVVGASRKSFLGDVLPGLSVSERDEATLATSVWAFGHGAAMVRVHDVDSSVRAARLLDVCDLATPEGVPA